MKKMLHRVKRSLFVVFAAQFCMFSHSPLYAAEIQLPAGQNSILRQKDKNFLLGSGIGLLVNGICYAANWPIINTVTRYWVDEPYANDYFDFALHSLSNISLSACRVGVDSSKNLDVIDETKQLDIMRKNLMINAMLTIGGNCLWSLFPNLNYAECGDQILGVASCYAGCKITEHAYSRIMDDSILPHLQEKLPAEHYNSLPHFYKNPKALTTVLTPIALTAYSNFLYRRSQNLPINDCIKSAGLKGITETINAYKASCNVPQPLTQSIFNVAQSFIIPRKAAAYRGISFTNSACMLALLAMNKNKLRDETPLIKSLALIGAGSLIARIAWLAYKQYKAPANDLIVFG